MDKSTERIARLVGGILVCVGIVSAILGIYAVQRQIHLYRALQMGPVAGAAFLFLLWGFCCLVGYRLLFNRTNRNGSLLSPTGWMVLAFVFLIIALTILATALGRGDHGLLLGALGLGVMGFGSVLAARGASRKGEQSPVFPPGTSLLQLPRFVPAGFVCGLEILNDNLTPMAFVVSVLQNCVGLSEPDATRTMIDIHMKGGALLPMASLDESKRVAELITTEAHAKNHPLVCRAGNKGSEGKKRSGKVRNSKAMCDEE